MVLAAAAAAAAADDDDDDKDDDDDDVKLTLQSSDCFAWNMQRSILDHAYAVTARALSLQPVIQADCTDYLSINNGNLRKRWMRCFHSFIILHVPAKKW